MMFEIRTGRTACDRTGVQRLGVALLALVTLVTLGGCTVSGAGFLHSNTEGQTSRPSYDYPPLPGGGSEYWVTVIKGDTVYSIATFHNVSVEDLADANGLYRPYTIQPGQKLRIPGPRVHRVAKGETLYSIARAYGVNAEELAEINSLWAPYRILPGQELVLPGTARRSKSGSTSAGSGSSGWRLNPFKPSKPKDLDRVPERDPLPHGGGRFIWPAQGKIISDYGPKGGGRHNDGINIAADLGTPILAIADGTVTYVGNELRSYGNLVLIRHSGNWVSAYAHTGKIWVAEGQTVKKGQHIANVGQSGDATSPQLHFELRRGSKSVDPATYLNAS